MGGEGGEEEELEDMWLLMGVKLEEEEGKEEAKVNLLGAPGAKLGRLAPALLPLLLPLLLLLSPRLLLPLLAPLLALVVVVGAIWNG